MTKIAIIIGSTRPGRRGEDVARWVLDGASKRVDATYELVDLLDFPLPHLDEPLPAAMNKYEHDHTKEWSAKIAQYDGFIFVTPEYNRSTTGVLKNAIDYLAGEWNNKAAAFVGYGVLGGTRAVEHLRLIAAELQMATVRSQVALSVYTDFEDFTVLKPAPQHSDALESLFTQLEAWATVLAPLRAA